MDFIKETVNIYSRNQKGCTELGVDGDIIVPDILPDILKIIQVDGISSVSSKEISDGKMTCTGKLNLKILYIPESETEKIKSIITSFDFSHTMTSSNLNGDTIADISSDVEKVDFQLINSRKLRIKSVVSLAYCFSCEEKIEVACGTDSEDMLEMRKKTIRVNSFDGFRDTQFLVRESLELPSGQSSVGEILKVDTTLPQVEYKAISGRVVVRGTCDVCVLYKDQGGALRYAGFEMPFTEIIDMENVTEDSVCEIELNPEDVTYHVENDSDGEARIIYTEVVVGVKCTAGRYVDMEYIEDCYCPGCNMTETKELRQLDNIAGISDKTVSVRESFSLPSGAPSISSIYNLIAKPVIDSVTTDDGCVRVEGKIECYCLYLCEGESPVYSLRKEIRFCENIETSGSGKGMDCTVSADIVHKSYSINSAGETDVKISVSVKVSVSSKVNVPVVTGFEIEELPDSAKKGIVIYFVQHGDNLWDIAKRYKVRTGDIAELNKLESENVNVGMQLLIPSV